MIAVISRENQNKSFRILFYVVFILFALHRLINWSAPNYTEDKDIWHIYQWAETLSKGDNPYAVWRTGEATTKSISYFPLYIMLGQIPMFLGFSTYTEWTSAMRLFHLAAELGIGLLLFKIASERQRPVLGIFGVIFWFFNSITLIVWEIQQIDGIMVFFAFWALYYVERRPNLAGFLLGCSIAIKPVTIFLGPIFLLMRLQVDKNTRLSIRNQIKQVLTSFSFIILVPVLISLPFLIIDFQSYLMRSFVHGVREASHHIIGRYSETYSEILWNLNYSFSFFEQTPTFLLRVPMILAYLWLYIIYWIKKYPKYLLASFSFLIYMYLSPIAYIHYFSWPIAVILAAVIIGESKNTKNVTDLIVIQKNEIRVTKKWNMLFLIPLLLLFTFSGIIRYYYLRYVVGEDFSFYAAIIMASDIGIGALIYKMAKEKNQSLLGGFGTTFWLLNQTTLYNYGILDNISIALFFVVLALYLIRIKPILANLCLGLGIVFNPLVLIFIPPFLINFDRVNKWLETGAKKSTIYIQLKPIIYSLGLILIIPIIFFPLVDTNYLAFFSNFYPEPSYSFLGISLPIKRLSLILFCFLIIVYIHRNDMDYYTYSAFAAFLFFAFTARTGYYSTFVWFLFVILYAIRSNSSENKLINP